MAGPGFPRGGADQKGGRVDPPLSWRSPILLELPLPVDPPLDNVRKADLAAWWRHLIDEIRCRRHRRPFPCVRSP